MKLAALAQSGLAYAESDFDVDRYHQIRRLSADLFVLLTERPVSDLVSELGRDVGYATPKVDVRGLIFDEQERVLLMRERTDGRWSAPGGWADAGDRPSDAVVREIAEETGYPARAERLIACLDRDVQGHTPQLPVHVYKLFFACVVTGPAVAPAALETLDVGWFALSELPPLSPSRITEYELTRALAHHRDPSLPTEFD